MIVAGLVAALVVGPSLLVHGLIWLTRRRLRPAPARPVDLETAGVAVLIVAQDESDRVLDALAAAREVVPAEHVHLVSNGSSDGTADLAHRLGAQVVETLGTLTTTGAVTAGIQAFHLLDRFSYVLVLDVDTRLAPGHLERALPLFADPTVAAVDARVAPDWLPPRRILAAYRARRYVLTQSFGRGRGGPPATAAHGLPGIGRLYRTSVLARLELDPPGLVEPDLDLTMQLYRRRLGRVALCPGAPAVTATSLRLREHRRLTRRAVTGLWQTRRRGRTGPALYAQLVELAVAAAVVALVPLAVVALALPVEWAPLAQARSVVGPVELALGLVLADLLLTAATALAAREPRYLLAGLMFPLLRVVDAVTVLRACLRRHPVPATRVVHVPEPVQRIVLPVQREAPERPRRVRRPRRWWLAVGWALWVAVAGAAVARVVVALPTLPASLAENELVQAAYARFAGIADRVPTVSHTLAATDVQLAGYTWLASPFDRHASVLTSARELSVVALVVLLVALLLLTVALRLHPLATAAAAAVLAAAGPSVAVLGTVGPGLVTAAWLGLATVSAVWIGKALVRDRLVLFTLAGLFTICTGLAAVATTPLVIIPVGVGVATWLWFLEFERYEPDTTWRGHAAVVLFATGGIAALLWRADLMLAPTGGVLTGTQRPALLAAITVAAGGALVVTRIRPLAMGTLTGVGLAVGFGAQADALLPVVVAAAAVVVAMLLDTAVRSPAPVVSGGLAAALTVAAAVTGLLIVPPVAPRAEHAALAAWVGNQVVAGGTVTVPSDTWADLHRDLGRQDPRTVVRRAGERPAEGMVVQHGPADGGFLLGHFGTLTLVTTHLDPRYLDPAPRATAGTQLARNSRLTASTQARNALLAGRVDMRAMAVLAGLCAEHEITLVRTGNSPHERGSRLPDRTVVVSTSDGRAGRAAVLDWLSAQEAPYAPATTRRTPEGFAISWRLPEPSDGATE
ncbi:MAG: glycosyltransferase [Actinophytocola sp.]|uniref:glycosyltransferase n=1 Tax=Actinophytocola sp. TaxID=1872138 RepID=UPI003D6B842E